MYPDLHQVLAFATLFVPSVFFWGAGIMKESIVLFGLGILVDGLFAFFYFKDKINFLVFIKVFFGFLILFKVKPYLLISGLLAFIPIFIHSRIRHLGSYWFRSFSRGVWYFLLGITAVSGIFLIGQVLAEYEPQKALEYLSIIQKSQLETCLLYTSDAADE